MYLPTFWKLTAEAGVYKVRHMAGWVVPAGAFGVWVIYPSLYNWFFTSIRPPPTGVLKRAVGE